MVKKIVADTPYTSLIRCLCMNLLMHFCKNQVSMLANRNYYRQKRQTVSQTTRSTEKLPFVTAFEAVHV